MGKVSLQLSCRYVFDISRSSCIPIVSYASIMLHASKHVSNLSVRNFLIFLLMYPGTVRVFQAVLRGHHLAGVADAGHGTALLPRPDHQTAAGQVGRRCMAGGTRADAGLAGY